MTSVAPLVLGLGAGEALIVVLVIVVLLFGAKKLPELARGSGRALRIFKAETKGLMDDDGVKDGQKSPEQKTIEERRRAEDAARAQRADTPVEHPRPDVER